MTFRIWSAILAAGLGVQLWSLPAAAEESAILFAHRGGSYEFEENTMHAFRNSYAKGLRGFETDIRMTQDGELVILHDNSLDRTHHGTGPVEHKTAAEVREITTRKTGEKMLFLSDLLDFLQDKPDFYLELEMKTSNKDLYPDARLEEYCRKLYAAANAKKPAGSQYVFTSFDERPLRLMKQIDPHVDLLYITSKPCSKEIIEKAQTLGVQRIGCRMEGTSRAAVREAQKAGLMVTGWPGHTLQDYFLAVGLGVDGICTDIPVQVQTWRLQHPKPTSAVSKQ